MSVVLLYLIIGLCPAVPGGIYAWLAWTGRRRRWVRQPRTFAPPPIFSWHKRNYWPFAAGAIGFGWGCWSVAMILETQLSTSSWVPVVIMGVGMGLMILLLCWWPEFLRPQWHKDWVARGGDRDRRNTPLYSDDELRARGELPVGISEKARRRERRAGRLP